MIKTYTENLPKRIPLSQNKEFKSIKNIVIKEVLNILVEDEGIKGANDLINNNQYSFKINHTKINNYTTTCVVRLLNHLSKILQNSILNVQKNQMIDRKLKHKINDKKQAHGLKQG